jgi:peptidoglycan/LPS O-acetylase OafA/YrhL
VLRGIAILGVIAHHAALYVRGLGAPTKFIGGFGKMGVQLFFVASAITLCLSTARRTERRPVLSFYLRRYFRIAPLYYLGIIFYALYSIPFNYFHGFGPHADAAYNLPDIAANILFVHGLYGPANNTVVPGGWSIATEMNFYTIFPLMFFLSEHYKMWRPAMAASIIVFCGAVEFAIGNLTGHWPWNTDLEYYSLLNQLPVFVIGILAYYLLQSSAIRRVPAAIAGALSLLVAGSLFNSQAHMAYYFIPILCACAFSALALILSQLSVGYPTSLINIGKRSYSIYILHFAFLHIVLFGWSALRIHLPPTLECLVVFLLTLGFADLAAQFTERQIERRGIDLGRRIISAVQTNRA